MNKRGFFKVLGLGVANSLFKKFNIYKQHPLGKITNNTKQFYETLNTNKIKLSLQELGSKYAFSKEVNFPVEVTIKLCKYF